MYAEKMEGISDIDNIISILDEKVMSGAGRIKITVDEDMAQGRVTERYHHGRCDVESPFSTGCIPTFDED